MKCRHTLYDQAGIGMHCKKKKCLVIVEIENETDFFMKRKFMDSAVVTLKFKGL